MLQVADQMQVNHVLLKPVAEILKRYNLSKYVLTRKEEKKNIAFPSL